MGIRAISIPIQVVSHSFPFPILSSISIPWDSHGILISIGIPIVISGALSLDRFVVHFNTIQYNGEFALKN